MQAQAGQSSSTLQFLHGRYAVVLKTYVWDEFVERQARRCEASAPGGDFFLSVDESKGSIGPVSFREEQVRRISRASCLALGLADRFHEGSLLWWNADYAHIDFYQAFPGYEFYLFLEYDAQIHGNLDDFVSKLAAQGADLAASACPEAKNEWCWTKPHLSVYSYAELQACLISICAFSNRGLAHLCSRRLALSKDPSLVYWPLAEAFLPTEIKRASLRFLPMEAFGDTSRMRWRPPCWEGEVKEQTDLHFLHPVYDTARYLHWVLKEDLTLSAFLGRHSQVQVALSVLPTRLYALPVMKAMFASLGRSIEVRVHLWTGLFKARLRFEST